MLKTKLHTRHLTALTLALGLLSAALFSSLPGYGRTESYLIQGADLASVKAAVQAAGGEITHELGIIRAVGARLTKTQLADLQTSAAVRQVYANNRVETAKKKVKTLSTAVETVDLTTSVSTEPTATTSLESLVTSASLDLRDVTDTATGTGHVTAVMAHLLQAEGITGDGVTLAVLDSGLSFFDQIKRGADDELRALAQYDAIADQELSIWSAPNDDNGHATHVQSISLNSEASSVTGYYRGIAPNAGLVAVKAFDANGQGNYADVIRGIDWLVENKEAYGIRVLNLSFSAPPQSHYWDDPLNQAVMAAWEAGIVVVASAGNTGPDPMTIGVPGNVPYVITVGAMTDNYTPDDTSDDKLASFSSTGPTVEGFVKPDLLAPGGHLVALMNDDGQIAIEHPEFRDEDGMYFTMSGTSQSAAVVSGVVALMLQADPSLSPDDVKCRLMTSARGARNADGSPRYSVLQQGAGLVDAHAAVYSAEYGCANRGLDIAQDLAGDRPLCRSGAPGRGRRLLYRDSRRPEHAVVRFDVVERLHAVE